MKISSIVTDTRFFPTVLIILDLAAAYVYWRNGGSSEWRMVGYWGSAALLTFFVTY